MDEAAARGTESCLSLNPKDSQPWKLGCAPARHVTSIQAKFQKLFSTLHTCLP
jgi:hypothetical protein